MPTNTPLPILGSPQTAFTPPQQEPLAPLPELSPYIQPYQQDEISLSQQRVSAEKNESGVADFGTTLGQTLTNVIPGSLINLGATAAGYTYGTALNLGAKVWTGRNVEENAVELERQAETETNPVIALDKRRRAGKLRELDNLASFKHLRESSQELTFGRGSAITGDHGLGGDATMPFTREEYAGELSDPSGTGAWLGGLAGSVAMSAIMIAAPPLAPAMLTTFGAMGFTSAKQSYLDHMAEMGLEGDQEVADLVGLAGGLVEVVSEKIGLDVLPAGIRKKVLYEIAEGALRGESRQAAKSAARAIALAVPGASVEAIEEMVASLGQNIAVLIGESVSGGPELTMEQITERLTHGMGEAALGGLIAGGALSGPMAGITVAQAESSIYRRAAKTKIERNNAGEFGGLADVDDDLIADASQGSHLFQFTVGGKEITRKEAAAEAKRRGITLSVADLATRQTLEAAAADEKKAPMVRAVQNRLAALAQVGMSPDQLSLSRSDVRRATGEQDIGEYGSSAARRRVAGDVFGRYSEEGQPLTDALEVSAPVGQRDGAGTPMGVGSADDAVLENVNEARGWKLKSVGREDIGERELAVERDAAKRGLRVVWFAGDSGSTRAGGMYNDEGTVYLRHSGKTQFDESAMRDAYLGIITHEAAHDDEMTESGAADIAALREAAIPGYATMTRESKARWLASRGYDEELVTARRAPGESDAQFNQRQADMDAAIDSEVGAVLQEDASSLRSSGALSLLQSDRGRLGKALDYVRRGLTRMGMGSDETRAVLKHLQRVTSRPAASVSEPYTGSTQEPKFSVSRRGLTNQTSLLTKAIHDTKERVMTAARFQRFLQTSSIKTEEIYWSGLEDYMKGKESINLDEVEAMLQPVDLKEITLGGGGEADAKRQEDANNAYRLYLKNQYVIKQKDGNGSENRWFFTLVGSRDPRDTHWASKDEAQQGLDLWIETQVASDPIRNLANYGSEPDIDLEYGPSTNPGMVVDGSFASYNEILVSFNKEGSTPPRTHWTEPGVVAHARITERETNRGRVLFVEEIQSDWHQKGRKQGYVGDAPPATALQPLEYIGVVTGPTVVAQSKEVMARGDAEWEWLVVNDINGDFVEAYPFANIHTYPNPAYYFSYGRTEAEADGYLITNESELPRSEETDRILSVLKSTHENDPVVHRYQRTGSREYFHTNVRVDIDSHFNSQGNLKAARSNTRPSPTLIANAPFKGSSAWSALMLKRVVILAAEDPDITAVVIIDGESTALRYDRMIADKVSTIKVTRGDGDGFVMDLTTVDGEELEDNRVEDYAQLVDNIGNKMADEAVARLNAGETSVEFTGDNMTVGGQGFKKFYDDIVRKEAEKIAKHLGVTMTTVPVGQPEENGEPRSFLAIPMTDAAREVIATVGLKLFSASSSGLSGQTSLLANVIANTKERVMTAPRFQRFLQTSSIKKEEIYWSGLEEYLKGKESINLDEVEAMLKPVVLEEKFLENKMTEPDADESDAAREAELTERRAKRAALEATMVIRSEVFENGMLYVLEGHPIGEDTDGPRTELGVYDSPEEALAGMESYLEDETTGDIGDWYDQQHGYPLKDDTKFGPRTHPRYTLPGPHRDYKETLITFGGSLSEPPDTHWDEVGVVAHARSTIRDTILGPVVFAEELQSDWHQKGRDKGYRDDVAPVASAPLKPILYKGLRDRDSFEAADARLLMQRLDENIRWEWIKHYREDDTLREAYPQATIYGVAQDKLNEYFFAYGREEAQAGGLLIADEDELARLNEDEVLLELRTRFLYNPPVHRYEILGIEGSRFVYTNVTTNLSRYYSPNMLGYRSERERQGNLVANAPFKGSSAWSALLIKRLVVMAAQTPGITHVVIIDGATTAKRTNQMIADKVSAIKVRLSGTDGYWLDFTNADGAGRPSYYVEKLSLAAFIGNKMAEESAKRLAAGETSVEFTGDNMTVGGKGFETFYDVIARKEMEKIAKYLGVTMTTVPVGEPEENGEPRSYMAIPMTDAAREKVNGPGFSLFSASKSKLSRRDFNQTIVAKFSETYSQGGDIGRETGFLLDDGTPVQMGVGYRASDHREIVGSEKELRSLGVSAKSIKEKNEGTLGYALRELLTLGSMIRTHIESRYIGLELGRGITATPEQRSAIRRFVDEISPSQVVIDRTSADGTVTSETLEDPSGEEVSLSLRFSASGTPLRVLAKHRAQLLSLRFPELGPSSFLEMTARNGVTVEPRLLAHKGTKAYHIDGLETSYAIREEADGSMRVFGMNSGSDNVPLVFEAAVFHAITRNPSSTVTIEGSTTSESDHRLMLRLQSLGVQVTVDTTGIFHGTISDLLDTRTRTTLAERGMAGWAVDSLRVRRSAAVGAGSVQPLSDNVDGNRSGLAVSNVAKGRSATSDSRGGDSRGTITDSARRIADRLIGSAERLANLTAEQLAAKLDRSSDLIPVGSTEHELIATYIAARVRHSGAVSKLRGAKIPGVSQTRKQGAVATALTELLAAGNALRAVQQPRFERYGSEWMPPSASGAVSKSVPIGTIFPGVVEASVQRVASMLNRHAINILGSVGRSDASTINIATLAMAAELEQGVNRGGKAVDWYEQTLKTVLVLWEAAFPVALVTDKENAAKNRGVLFAIFAITSNGQTVDLNTSTTLRAFEVYLKTGRIAFPKGYSAVRSKAMKKSFALLNKMLKVYGSAKTFDLLAIRGTSRAVMMDHVKQIRKDIGGTIKDVKFDASIPDGLPMQLSQIFGPKIGAFYANLNGNFDILTADLWFTRTFLYYSGFLTAPENHILRSRFVELQEISGLIDDGKPVTTNRLALVKKDVPRDQADIKAAAIALGFKTSMMENPAHFAAWVQTTASDFVKAKYKEGGLPVATLERGPLGEILTISTLPAPVQEAARAILHGLKTIYEGDPTINEAPANAPERAAMATAVRRAMVMQAKGGALLEVSAAQAVLWYFEKDVYYAFNAGERGEGQDYAVLSRKHLAPRLIANGARHLLSAGRRTGAVRTRSSVQSGRPNDVTHNAARAAEFMSDDAGEKIIALAQDYRDGKLSFNSFEGSISAAWELTGTDRNARMQSERNRRSILTPAFDVARLRAGGIQYSASKRTLQGEYWFTNDGMVQDASNDENHELLSMQQAAWDFKSWIVDSEFSGWKGVDAAYGDDVRTDLRLSDEAFVDLFRPFGGLKTPTQRKKFIAALAAKNPTASTDQIALAMRTLFDSDADARLYATSLGWIRVHGNNIEVRSVTSSSIRTMADGIYEVWGETANDQLFTIDALDQRRTFDDVPFSAIASNNVIELIPYRGVQYSASRFPRLYHGSKNKFEKFGVQKSAFGYFFTDNKDVAAKYGDNLKQVELNATNPADLRDIQQFLRTAPTEFAAWIDDEFEGDVGQFVDWIEGGDLYTRNVGRAQNSLMQELKGHGYDVVIFSDVAPSDVDGSEPTEGSSDSYVVFDESKIGYVESGLTARDTQYSAGTLSAMHSLIVSPAPSSKSFVSFVYKEIEENRAAEIAAAHTRMASVGAEILASDEFNEKLSTLVGTRVKIPPVIEQDGIYMGVPEVSFRINLSQLSHAMAVQVGEVLGSVLMQEQVMTVSPATAESEHLVAVFVGANGAEMSETARKGLLLLVGEEFDGGTVTADKTGVWTAMSKDSLDKAAKFAELHDLDFSVGDATVSFTDANKYNILDRREAQASGSDTALAGPSDDAIDLWVALATQYATALRREGFAIDFARWAEFAGFSVETGERIARRLRSAVGGKEVRLSAGRSPLSFQVGLLNTIRTRGQDSFILLEKAIESFESAHGALQPSLNPLLAIRRMPAAVADKQKTFRTETVNPILNRMKLAGISMAQMGEYLFALHAPERNRYILQINPGSKGVGSGMTDDQSLVIVESVEKMSNVAEWKSIAREWQAIARDSLDTQLAAGLIKQSDHDNIVARYPNYVPMPDAPEGSGSRVEREVARFSLNKKQLKSSVGRGADAATEESFEAIIPELVGQRETVMSRAFRNIVANRFMRLAKYKNEPGLWSIVKPKKIRVMNVASGTVEEVEDDTWREDPQIMQVLAINPFSYSITEQVDGKDVTTDYEVEAGDLVLVYINNLELGTNLTRGSTQSDHWAMTIVRVARFWSGWVRMFATSAFNPDFLLSNPTRDVQTAAATIATEHKDAKSILKAFAMGYPSAWKAVYNALHGRKVGKHAKHWDDFERLGGRQQLFIAQDFETRYEELQAQLDDPTRWERNQDRAKYALIGFWDNLNNVMDNATRFAFYVALVEAGVHPEIAAVKARNLTVDFTKRGSETGVVMGMYAFANASIQGTTKFVVMSRTRRGKQVIGSLFAFGFINAMLQDLLSDDDEDKNGVKDALQVEEYKHQTNAIIPTGMDFAIKIPLSYGLNIPYVLGRNLYRAMSGKVSAAGAAGDSAKAMMATFNPFGGEGVTDSGHGFIRSLMPDILDIPTDLAFNKDYRGNPISHVSPWEKDPVMSETGSKKVPQPVKSFAQLLNSASGGDYATSGVLDFPPDSIWYVFQQLVGGTGKSFERIGISVANLIDGQVEISTVPGLRRFAEGYPSDESNTSLYYTMRDEVFTHDENAKRYESSAEQSKARRANPFLERLVDNFKLAEKELKELKKELRAAEAAGNEALVEIKLDKIAKQRTKAVKAYSDAKNRQK